MKMKQKSNKYRNFHAIDPIMKKGGFHGKSNKAKRKNYNQKVLDRIEDLYDDCEYEDYFIDDF